VYSLYIKCNHYHSDIHSFPTRRSSDLNRGKIVTAMRDESKLGEVLSFLRTQLEAGRQLYVIYPLIDESEKLDVKAASAEYELWRSEEHTSELQSRFDLVCRLLLEKKKK